MNLLFLLPSLLTCAGCKKEDSELRQTEVEKLGCEQSKLLDEILVYRLSKSSVSNACNHTAPHTHSTQPHNHNPLLSSCWNRWFFVQFSRVKFKMVDFSFGGNRRSIWPAKKFCRLKSRVRATLRIWWAIGEALFSSEISRILSRWPDFTFTWCLTDSPPNSQGHSNS